MSVVGDAAVGAGLLEQAMRTALETAVAVCRDESAQILQVRSCAESAQNLPERVTDECRYPRLVAYDAGPRRADPRVLPGDRT